MLAEAALLLCLATNATADVGGRAEVRSGVFTGYDETQPPAASLDLRLRPEAVLSGHRPALDGRLTYATDLRLSALGLNFVPFASHNFGGSVEGGRTTRGARFGLNASLSLGQISYDPVLDDGTGPVGITSVGQGVAVPFTATSIGGSLSSRPTNRWSLAGTTSGRLFFVPLLDEDGAVIPGIDPEIRYGPDGQLSVERVLNRAARVGARVRGSLILGPSGALVYSDAIATAGWSQDLIPAWPFTIRAGWMWSQQPGFSPGLLPVGDVSLTARLPEGLSATISTGVNMTYDAFNDAGVQQATASAALSRRFGRALELTLSGRAMWRLLIVTRRAATGDDVVGVGRLSGIYTMSDNLFFEGGFVFSSRFRDADGRNVLQGQIFIAAQGGAGWES